MWVSPRWFVILRDLSLLVTGVIGILHQEFTGQASPLLLAVYTSLLGIPGAANVIAILRGTSSSPPPPSVLWGTGGATPPSPPASPAASSESSSLSTPSADE
jgi:hypothetical protein